MALVGDDCFFFLNSGCVRGSQCGFRHQPSARITPIVCPEWLRKSCFKPNCILRHNNDRVPCYYEANMGTCLKPNCHYLHTPKSNPPVLPTSAVVNSLPVPPPMPPMPAVMRHPLSAVPLPNMPHMAQMTVPPCVEVPTMKLNPMMMGSRPQLQMVSAVKAISPKCEQVTPLPPQVMNAPVNVAIIGVPPAGKGTTVFPKNEHFSEQVRLFKEMLAAKTGAVDQRKKKDNERHTPDDEKNGAKGKERQRSKKDRKEKEGHKSHRSKKESKEVWSKGDEEILYGDYKNVPLNKKPKRKKHKQQKSDDSDTEVNVKSYEEILREKALRKLFSKRKEKFNEDFEELVSDKIEERKVKHNGDSDVAERFDLSTPKEKRVFDTSTPKEERRVFIPSTPTELIPSMPKEERHVRVKSSLKEDIHISVNSSPEERLVKSSSPEERKRAKSPLPKEHRRVKSLSPEERKRAKSSSPQECIRVKSPSLEEHKRLKSPSLEEHKRLKSPSPEEHKRLKSPLLQERRRHKSVSPEERRRDKSSSPEEDEIRAKSSSPEEVSVKIVVSPEEERQVKSLSPKQNTPTKRNSKKEESVIFITSNVEEEKSKKLTDKLYEPISDNEEAIEKALDSVSPEKKRTKEKRAEIVRKKKNQTVSDTDSDYSNTSELDYNYGYQAKNTAEKKSVLVIPDETTNIDFEVDYDDDLAMEINQNERYDPKSKKISSVINIINKYPHNGDSPTKKKYRHKSPDEGAADYKMGSSRYSSKSDIKLNDRDHGKFPDSNDRDRRRKIPKAVSDDKPSQSVESKNKLVKLTNSDESEQCGRVTDPAVHKKNTDTDPLTKPNEPKVKTFEEIMAEKHKRNHGIHLVGAHYKSSVIAIDDDLCIPKTLKEKSTQAKLEILNMARNENGSTVTPIDAKPNGKQLKSVLNNPRASMDEDKQLKRKSLQLYKPPHPNHKDVHDFTTEVKTVVDTGPRKIIRIRKASLSTGLIDPPTDNLETNKFNNASATEAIKVLSFEEIIREKRQRQLKERELAKQTEKENATTKENSVSPSTNNTTRRKPVLRRQIPASTSHITAGSRCISTTLWNVDTTVVSNSDSRHRPLAAVTEFKQPVTAVTESKQPTTTVTEFKQPATAFTEFKQSVTALITDSKKPVIATAESKKPISAIAEFKKPVSAIAEFKKPVTVISEFKKSAGAISEFKKHVSAIAESKKPLSAIAEYKRTVRGTTEFKQAVSAISGFRQPVNPFITNPESMKPVNAITKSKNPVNAITESKHPVNAITESKRPVTIETNVAKVSPLQVVHQKTSKRNLSNENLVSPQTEALENNDFYSRLRNSSSRPRRKSAVAATTRTLRSVTLNPLNLQNDDASPSLPKVRRRSVTSHAESTVTPTPKVATLKISPYTFNSTVQQNTTSYQTKMDTPSRDTQRKNIQEALDEERRKKEQDLLSDDEFEKEINELCSGSDDDEDFDDINEDDLMMELEQMIDG